MSVIHKVIDRLFQGQVYLIGLENDISVRWQDIIELATVYPKEFKGDKSKKAL